MRVKKVSTAERVHNHVATAPFGYSGMANGKRGRRFRIKVNLVTIRAPFRNPLGDGLRGDAVPTKDVLRDVILIKRRLWQHMPR
jgi:hypothetical protein